MVKVDYGTISYKLFMVDFFLCETFVLFDFMVALKYGEKNSQCG